MSELQSRVSKNKTLSRMQTTQKVSMSRNPFERSFPDRGNYADSEYHHLFVRTPMISREIFGTRERVAEVSFRLISKSMEISSSSDELILMKQFFSSSGFKTEWIYVEFTVVHRPPETQQDWLVLRLDMVIPIPSKAIKCFFSRTTSN